jgi:hypothetical protein
MNKRLNGILSGAVCLLLASVAPSVAQVKPKAPAKPAAVPAQAAPAAEGSTGIVAPQASADGTQPPASEWISRYLQIDEKKPLNLTLQTCDLKGCYAATPIAPELLAELKAGKKLAVSFQNLTK